MFQEQTYCFTFSKKELRYFSSSSAESFGGGWLAWFKIGQVRKQNIAYCYPVGRQSTLLIPFAGSARKIEKKAVETLLPLFGWICVMLNSTGAKGYSHAAESLSSLGRWTDTLRAAVFLVWDRWKCVAAVLAGSQCSPGSLLRFRFLALSVNQPHCSSLAHVKQQDQGSN